MKPTSTEKLPESQPIAEINQNEIFLTMGDFNIDCVPVDQKLVPRQPKYTEQDIVEITEYYQGEGLLDSSLERVRAFIDMKSRYGLLMALLNSGTLEIVDLQMAVLNKFLVTFGDVVKDESDGEYRSQSPNFHSGDSGTSQQGLDYVMMAVSPGQSIQNKVFQIEDLCRREFYVEKKPYKHLSDHFGLQVSFKFN